MEMGGGGGRGKMGEGVGKKGDGGVWMCRGDASPSVVSLWRLARGRRGEDVRPWTMGGDVDLSQTPADGYVGIVTWSVGRPSAASGIGGETGENRDVRSEPFCRGALDVLEGFWTGGGRS